MLSARLTPLTHIYAPTPDDAMTSLRCKARTSIAYSKGGKLAGTPVIVPAAVNDDLDETGFQEGLIEGEVIAAQVAHNVAGARPDLTLRVLQQWPEAPRYPCLHSRGEHDEWKYGGYNFCLGKRQLSASAKAKG